MYREEIIRYIENNKEKYEALSDAIWDYAEPKFREHRSAALQADFLADLGFSVTRGIGGLKTAFVAEYGHGAPVVAILGEFDALPGLAQESDVAEPAPPAGGGCGHGCGHNLLGVAGMEAATVAKQLLDENKLAGTIRYYGCPAEESGAGKAFMLRAGCFEGVDAALHWHPASVNKPMNSSLANLHATFTFEGVSAHAGAEPHLGRSALDAVELMNVGANYLREHIIPEARMHYATTDPGGDVPNIVQARAQSLYCIRAPHSGQLREIYERVCDVARGAALMTGTRVTIAMRNGYAELVKNQTLDRLIIEKLQTFLPIAYSEEDMAYARPFAAAAGTQPEAAPIITEFIAHAGPDSFSTDAGDVSWVVPTAGVMVCCFAAGTPLHRWTATAQGKSSLAHKGMHTAASALAATALELFTHPETVQQARADFDATLAGQGYQSFLPADAGPEE